MQHEMQHEKGRPKPPLFNSLVSSSRDQSPDPCTMQTDADAEPVNFPYFLSRRFVALRLPFALVVLLPFASVHTKCDSRSRGQ